MKQLATDCYCLILLTSACMINIQNVLIVLEQIYRRIWLTEGREDINAYNSKTFYCIGFTVTYSMK